MAKKKKTLAQQYDEQVRRIEKRLQQLAAEGYDVVSEWHLSPETSYKETSRRLEKGNTSKAPQECC